MLKDDNMKSEFNWSSLLCTEPNPILEKKIMLPFQETHFSSGLFPGPEKSPTEEDRGFYLTCSQPNQNVSDNIKFLQFIWAMPEGRQ